jgi:hypothetical protein
MSVGPGIGGGFEWEENDDITECCDDRDVRDCKVEAGDDGRIVAGR